MNAQNLHLTNEWDKTFQKSEKVGHSKVTFHNRYGITLAADMYVPKNADGKLPALAVSGPFGAVKEQSSGLYAQTMAERGFLTIAFDPSFTGESGGVPRYVASPDINTEDFCAAVDFLSVQENVDPERIGIIGICGWGGMHDIGILVSTDPVALDQACIDLVWVSEGNQSFVNRVEDRNGLHTLEKAEDIGLGNRNYRLIDISR